MADRVISSLTFGQDGGVEIQYMDIETDVRNKGLLVATHALRIRPGGIGDYETEIEELRSGCERVLADALEDFDTTPAVDLSEEPDEDDDDDDDDDE